MGKTELSIRAYAAHRKSKGLSGGAKSAVERALKSGRISRTASGKIDPVVADAEWAENSDPSKLRGIDNQAPTQKSAGPRAAIDDDGDSKAKSYAEARAEREHYQAGLARLEYEEQAGMLTSTEAVKGEAFRLGRLTREKVLAVPSRIAAIVAAKSDPREIELLMLDELRQALSGVAGG